MRIVLGSDHAGRVLRQALAEQLRAAGHEPEDLGTHGTESVDYPLIARRVCETVLGGSARLGVLVCGSGIGMSMAANKLAGIRAALCTDEYHARMARAHNDANVLCLGERVVGLGVAAAILDTFVGTSFEGGRHARRVAQIDAMGKDPLVGSTG